MMDSRTTCCQDSLDIYSQFGNSFISNILTEDETVLSLYLPYSKRDSMEWKFPKEKPTLKMRSGTSHRQCFMLTLFWDYNGVVLADFAEKAVKINSSYYGELLKQARNKRRKPRGKPYWFLHDNAPIHTSRETQGTLQDLGITPLNHPPYSPDLAPSDYYMFRHMKKHLSGQTFNTRNS